MWFVVSVNIKRRQLDPSQLAGVALELETLYAIEAKKRYAETVGRPSKQSEVNSPQIERALQARDQAADVVGVSPPPEKCRFLSDGTFRHRY